MTKATMPELIWAHVDEDGFTDYTNMKGWKENGIESPYEGAEYIRADLAPAQGGADKPLEEGQWRWVKIDYEGRWFVAHVINATLSNRLSLRVNGVPYASSTLAVVGPVIQEPED